MKGMKNMKGSENETLDRVPLSQVLCRFHLNALIFKWASGREGNANGSN
jgi:hypothetical protein